MTGEKAIVLVSGGLDSCVSAAYARDVFTPENCIPINFAYGQRHARELVASEKVSEHLFNKLPRTINLSQAFFNIGGSSLTSGVREGNPSVEQVSRTPDALPPSFVPGRNIIMLAVAAAIGYTERAYNIIGGWNVLDYSGYPDCRPEFFTAMGAALNTGLGFGLRSNTTSIHTPLVTLTKAEIIDMGLKLGAPLHFTWSCYAGGSEPCGTCDSCVIRAEGFAKAGVPDPATR